MQALHVGPSVLQWLSHKEKAHSHLDAPTGISCLATLALLDTFHAACTHPMAHTPDLMLSSENPHMFLVLLPVRATSPVPLLAGRPSAGQALTISKSVSGAAPKTTWNWFHCFVLA